MYGLRGLHVAHCLNHHTDTHSDAAQVERVSTTSNKSHSVPSNIWFCIPTADLVQLLSWETCLWNPTHVRGAVIHFLVCLLLLAALSSIKRILIRSNIILLITYRIAKHLRSVKIEQEYRLYFYSVTIFSAVFATVNGFFMCNNAVNFIYLSLKTLSVLLNIVLLALILHKVYHIMKISSGTNLRHRSVPGEAPPRSNPVYVLVTRQVCLNFYMHSYSWWVALPVFRLQYYCVVQTFTRIGASWYQIQYGFDSDSYDKNDASVMQNVSIEELLIINHECDWLCWIGGYVRPIYSDTCCRHWLSPRVLDNPTWCIQVV